MDIGRDFRNYVPTDVAWAFEKNPDIANVLLAKYPPNHDFWDYLEKLVGFLKTANCDGIQDKILDAGVNNLPKFESIISEFEVAKRLSMIGKEVRLLPDAFLSGKSPDLLVGDSAGEYYVEVARLSDDSTMRIISEEITRLLADSHKPYRVDVTLSRELSVPAIDYRERSARVKHVRRILRIFGETLVYELPRPPLGVVIERVKFEISETSTDVGFVGMIHSGTMSVALNEYSKRIRHLVADPRFGKAVKRLSWKGGDLLRPYIIAFDLQPPFVHEENFIEALFGSRHHYSYVRPNMPIPRQIESAANSGWEGFLKTIHLIPTGKTAFTSQGIFLTNPICKNVSGVAFMKRWKNIFQLLPNPFAAREINDPRLLNFLS